jgi:hypothetical protein
VDIGGVKEMVARIKTLVFTDVKPGFFVLTWPLEPWNPNYYAICSNARLWIWI